MVDNEDLVDVQLFVLNIPIVGGFAPMRWKQSMNAVPAKDEGHTEKIVCTLYNFLRRIQILFFHSYSATV